MSVADDQVTSALRAAARQRGGHNSAFLAVRYIQAMSGCTLEEALAALILAEQASEAELQSMLGCYWRGDV